MSRDSAWSAYLTARHQDLALHERMVDRTQSAATTVEPRHLSQADLDAWLALLREEESVVRLHREAFELYCYRRLGTPATRST